MKKYLSLDENGYSFLDILLDERVVFGDLAVSRDLVRKAGGINTRLKAKRKYELVLRIAGLGNVKIEEVENDIPDYNNLEKQDGSFIFFDDNETEGGIIESLTTDCYLIAKYSEELIVHNLFNPAVESILAEAEDKGLKDETIALLEGFLSRNDNFYIIDDCTRPVLIFKGNDTCYNVLNTFADELKKSIEKSGYKTEIFDVDREDWKEVVRYQNKHYKAVVGFQSFLFSVKMEDGKRYLADFIKAPKFNFLLDAPICFSAHLGYKADDFTILTHDINYKNFLEKHYKQQAKILPPGGMIFKNPVNITERKYELTFLGSYGDYRKILLELEGLSAEDKAIGNAMFERLKTEPELTLEAGFDKVIKERGLVMDEDTYLVRLHRVRRVLYAASYYFREKAIKAILESGLRLTVFGESFKNSPFAGCQNLNICEEVPAERSLEVYENSKISLNFMTWHKAGLTERMANIMLAGAVLLTDCTDGFSEGAGEDFVDFKLSAIDSLPEKIKELLKNDSLLSKIAHNGRKRAINSMTWDKRAEELLELI